MPFKGVSSIHHSPHSLLRTSHQMGGLPIRMSLLLDSLIGSLTACNASEDIAMSSWHSLCRECVAKGYWSTKGHFLIPSGLFAKDQEIDQSLVCKPEDIDLYAVKDKLRALLNVVFPMLRDDARDVLIQEAFRLPPFRYQALLLEIGAFRPDVPSESVGAILTTRMPLLSAHAIAANSATDVRFLQDSTIGQASVNPQSSVVFKLAERLSRDDRDQLQVPATATIPNSVTASSFLSDLDKLKLEGQMFLSKQYARRSEHEEERDAPPPPPPPSAEDGHDEPSGRRRKREPGKPNTSSERPKGVGRTPVTPGKAPPTPPVPRSKTEHKRQRRNEDDVETDAKKEEERYSPIRTPTYDTDFDLGQEMTPLQADRIREMRRAAHMSPIDDLSDEDPGAALDDMNSAI